MRSTKRRITMEFTLRQIAEEVAVQRDPTRQPDRSKLTRINERARMLRDQGAIRTSIPPSPGKTTRFTAADTILAVVILHMSLNGHKNSGLKYVAESAEKHITPVTEQILEGEVFYLRMDFSPTQVDRWFGGEEVFRVPLKLSVTESLLGPVTNVAYPVLESLRSEV